jgi:hypothetical protein
MRLGLPSDAAERSFHCIAHAHHRGHDCECRGGSRLNKRLLNCHQRQVARAKEHVELSEPDLRTPEQITAAREAGRSAGGRRGGCATTGAMPSIRKQSGAPHAARRRRTLRAGYGPHQASPTLPVLAARPPLFSVPPASPGPWNHVTTGCTRAGLSCCARVRLELN